MTLPPEALKLPASLLAHASLLPDRYDIPALLPKHGVFVEVGVALGNWTKYVMEVAQPAQVVMVDTFGLHEEATLWGQSTEAAFEGLTHEVYIRRKFADPIAAGRVRVIASESAAGIAQLADDSVDVIYIDADHRYEYVRQDLAAALPKVRRDGWIVVNDYIMVDGLNATVPYGVVNATNEFMIEHDWAIQYFALQTNMFCDVALRPAAWLAAQDRRASLEAENAALRLEVAALRSSRSWAVTAPLRAIGGLLPRAGVGRGA